MPTLIRLKVHPDLHRRVPGEGAGLPMFSWSPRQRVRIENIDAEAEAFIGYFGGKAYSEARRREREASSDAIAEDWSSVALLVARKIEGRVQSMAGSGAVLGTTGKPGRLDMAIKMAMDADFSTHSDATGAGSQQTSDNAPRVDPIEKLRRIVNRPGRA